MGFFDNVFRGKGKYPNSVVKSVKQSAETLNTIVNESIQLASSSIDLETKKSRLDYAMKKLVELIKLANEYSFLDFRKISSIYESIREVRNEIREMEHPDAPEIEIRELPVSEMQPSVVRKKTSGIAVESATCPYCDYHFPVMPQRKDLCPSCNKVIYVWYSTTQNLKKLITEDDAHRITREITEHIEKYELLNKQDTLDKTEEDVKHLQEELLEKDPTATLDDAYLFLLNNKIWETRAFSEKSRLHYLKALILDNSEKDFYPDLRESKRLELLHLKTHDYVRKVQIITNPDSCKICKRDSDQILTIEDALERMPLPHKDCSRPMNCETGFCRCSYLIVND